MGIHVAGWASNGTKGERYVFQLSQNGVPVSTIYGDEFERAGYKVTAIAPCAAKIDYGDDVHFFARCDLPRQTMNPGGAVAVSYTHLTLPTSAVACRSRWSPDH